MLVLAAQLFPGKFADIVQPDKAIYGRWCGNNLVTMYIADPAQKPYMEVFGVLSHIYRITAMQ